MLYPRVDSFLFFSTVLSDKKQSYFTLHRLHLSPLLRLLSIPLCLPHHPALLFVVLKLAWLWTRGRKMKVTGGYHGTMRQWTHAEGFHALSATHISTSALRTQDPPPSSKAKQTGKPSQLYQHPTLPILLEALSLSLHKVHLIKPRLSKTCPQSSNKPQCDVIRKNSHLHHNTYAEIKQNKKWTHCQK